MRRSELFIALVVLAGVGAGVSVLLALDGCLPPAPSLDAASYGAAQLACVAEAGTKQEADECRCLVQARYGRKCTGYVALSKYDGGGP